MKRALEVVGWAAGILIFALATHSVFAQGEQQITVTVRPSQTVEERVADEFKEKELRRAAEEKRAAEGSARIAAANPRALLGRGRTLYVQSSTSFFEPVQLQNALRKRDEMEAWGLAIIDTDWNKRDFADLIVEVDRPLFTYTFTYQISDRSTGIVLATGKVTAFDGNAAAPKLASRIIGDIRKARGEDVKKEDAKKKEKEKQ